MKLPEAEREKHTYLLGATGSGKSEMLKTLIWETIRHNKAAIVVLDPKGDLARESSRFLEHALPHRKDKLVYISPFDIDGYTPVLNPFQLTEVSAGQYEMMVDITTKELTRVLHNIFTEMDNAFTGLMQSVLSPCIDTLIRKGDGDFWDLLRFMDDDLNEDLVELGANSPNASVSRFFLHDFQDITQATRDGIKWRTRLLLQSQIFSRLTSGRSTIDLKQLINRKACIIFNLDKATMSADVSGYFGKIVVSLIQIIAQQRGGLPDNEKIPCHVFIDEMHNYVTRSIQDVLAEARSNKLYLTLAQQIVWQGISDRDFRRVLMGNTNIKILAKSTHENYKELADDFGIETERLQQLPKFYFYIKIGHGAAVRVKGRDRLVKYKHAISEKQWQQVLLEQTERYYMPVGRETEKRKSEALQRERKKSEPKQSTMKQSSHGKGEAGRTKQAGKDNNDIPPDDTKYSF